MTNQKTAHDIDTCKKMFFLGFFLLPFVWFVNFAWFYDLPQRVGIGGADKKVKICKFSPFNMCNIYILHKAPLYKYL